MSADQSLDSILVQIGEFGKYQSFAYFLICVSITLHAAVNVMYVFAAMDLQYRCKISSCESNEYNPDWLQYAVPFDEDGPVRCKRFGYKSTSLSNCTIDAFNQSYLENCDSYIYERPKKTIVQDLGLHCDENTWKLTFIGTINHIGQFVGMPLTGFVSDRYGRKTTLILGMIFGNLAGLLRSFVTSYSWYLIFEFLDAAFGAGTYSCAFVLGVELVGPEKRVISGTGISSCYAIGEIICGLVAWMTQSWRPLTQILYTPGFFLIFYYWLIPESVRWLLSKGRTEKAIDILKRASKVNGRNVSEDVLNKLTMPEEPHNGSVKYPLFQIFKSKTLILRFINCCFIWITFAFLFYGLTINSTSLAGNPYLDFILTAIAEIPAYFATYLLLDRIGRKASISSAFFLTGISCIAFIFISKEIAWLRLTIYLTGKFGATLAMTVCYVYTSEMFPTSTRHSLMGICSMIGRLGSMAAPQMPLLAKIWKPFPLVSFAGMAISAGFLSLFFPETSKTKLPDTIEEAENIGKTSATPV